MLSSPFPDVIRMSNLTFSFLKQLDSGILCQQHAFLWPMIQMAFSPELDIFYLSVLFSFLVTSCLAMAVQPCMEWIPIKKKTYMTKLNTWYKKWICTIGKIMFSWPNSLQFTILNQGSTKCAHGDKRARNVHAKSFSLAWNYFHVNQPKHFQVVLKCCLKKCLKANNIRQNKIWQS